MASLAAELFLTGVSVFTVVVTVFPTTDETVSFGVHKLYFELASSLQLYIYIYIVLVMVGLFWSVRKRFERANLGIGTLYPPPHPPLPPPPPTPPLLINRKRNMWTLCKEHETTTRLLGIESFRDFSLYLNL